MNVTVYPGVLHGTIAPPPSKSMAHRLLIAGALAGGESVLRGLSWNQDTRATAGCLSALGAELGPLEDGTLTLRGIRNPPKAPPLLDCGESGSTLRFLIPLALALAGGGVFTGHGRLMQRPQGPYEALLREKGVFWDLRGDTLTVRGQLTPGDYALSGGVSSQFITGLLYALPLLPGDSRILLTSPLESRAYVDMTLAALERFGVRVREIPGGYLTPGNQRYAPREAVLEGDWSQAAFFLAANFLGSRLTLTGMDPDSRQGDRIIADYAEALAGPGHLSLEVSGCPDLVPALAAMAAFRAGRTTRITGAARLRIKESDRLAAVTDVLRALGADVSQEPDALELRGKARLPGGVRVSAWNDHRIAMMAAVAAAACDAPVTITGAECVNKSYPEFFDDFAALGGRMEAWE